MRLILGFMLVLAAVSFGYRFEPLMDTSNLLYEIDGMNYWIRKDVVGEAAFNATIVGVDTVLTAVDFSSATYDHAIL